MCILAVKPANILAPPKETLKQMFLSNKDGAGVAYVKNNTIVIKKGLMTEAEFLAAVEKIPTESAALIHCRISTAGGVCQELTHPYPLTNNYNALTKTRQILKATASAPAFAVAHNGVFYGLPEIKERSNDTMSMIANILTPLEDAAAAGEKHLTDAAFDACINKLVSGSRLAILSTDNTYKKYGDGWLEDGGVFYSNATYKTYTGYSSYGGWYGSGKTYAGYGGYGGYYGDYWDDGDDVLFCKQKTQQKMNLATQPKNKAKNTADNESIAELVKQYPTYRRIIYNYYFKEKCSAHQIKYWIESGALAYEL